MHSNIKVMSAACVLFMATGCIARLLNYDLPLKARQHRLKARPARRNSAVFWTMHNIHYLNGTLTKRQEVWYHCHYWPLDYSDQYTVLWNWHLLLMMSPLQVYSHYCTNSARFVAGVDVNTIKPNEFSFISAFCNYFLCLVSTGWLLWTVCH